MSRPYTPADREAVLQIFRPNTPEYFAPEEEADLIDYLRDESEHFFVFEEKGRIIAAGGYNLIGTQGRLSWYFTDPAHAGKGAASAIARHSLAELKVRPEITEIMVRTSQHAESFFARFGFQTQKTVADFWAKGIDLYQMVLR
jgi:ribosomal-protein-alanine N-acetyltransferase